MSVRAVALVVALCAIAASAGCGGGPETTLNRSLLNFVSSAGCSQRGDEVTVSGSISQLAGIPYFASMQAVVDDGAGHEIGRGSVALPKGSGAGRPDSLDPLVTHFSISVRVHATAASCALSGTRADDRGTS